MAGKKTGGVRDSGPAMAYPLPQDALLEKGLETLGFPETDSVLPSGLAVRGRASIIPLVKRYIREIELFNAAFDLVGVEPGTEQGRCDLVVRHILDSLSPWKEIADLVAPDAGSPGRIPEIADAGSGAGFPGIPLSVAFPGVRFTLVERMSKRCAFLENCAAVMGLKNVEVLASEVEKGPAGRFDVVVFRAFRPLDQRMTRSLLRLTRAGDGCIPAGKLAAWKARKDKIAAEMEGIAGEIDGWSVRELTVPFLEFEERNLVITASARSRCQSN